MNIRTKDGLTDVIEGLRSELGAIKEELRIIDIRKPALESRAERIAEAIQTLVGDGSTGDPRWMQLPRITDAGIASASFAAPSSDRHVVHRQKRQIGPLRRPEISDEAIQAMADYTEKARRPVKSAELYEYLVREGFMEAIETEMPYKSFAITLRNVQQEYIEYDRASKTWSLKNRSPRAKLQEALEKGDGTRVTSSNKLGINRAEHPFVKAVLGVFKDNRWESLSPRYLYDELSDKPEFGLIPGVGSLSEFTNTLSGYSDFFTFDEDTETYRASKPEMLAREALAREAVARETVSRETVSPRMEMAAGVPGLYTVKSNGGVTV